MKKTLNINLAGFIFHIDDDAYLRLERYLDTLKSQFLRTDGGREIISDIESRIAELFKEKVGTAKEVITVDDVNEVIGIMGRPEDYLDAEAEEARNETYTETFVTSKRIFRDTDNRIIGGVSSGLAAYFNTDPLWIRILFVVLTVVGGFGLPLYIIMWIVIPKARTTAEKLQMRGESVNISNIERSIREEMDGLGDSFKKKASEYDYRKTRNHVGGFFSDLGNFLADAFKLFFRFLGKLIGFLFLLVGFLVLLAVCVGIFAGSVKFLGSDYSIGEMLEFLRLVTVTDGHYNFVLTGIALSIIGPLFLTIYWGIRILFDLEPLNRPTRAALITATFVGFVMLVVGSVRIGMQFQNRAYVEEDVVLPGDSQNFILMVRDDLHNIRDYEDKDWLALGDGRHAFRNVRVNVKQSETGKPYLRLEKEAEGPDRRDARIFAKDIVYNFEVQDSAIVLPSYLILNEGDRFRNQEVSVTLYLVPGQSVYFDESLYDVIYDVKNLQETWDFEMLDKKWIMLPEGLNCEGCEVPVKEEEGQFYNGDENTKDINIKIDSNGVEIEMKKEKGDVEGMQVSRSGPVYTPLQILNCSLPLYI